MAADSAGEPGEVTFRTMMWLSIAAGLLFWVAAAIVGALTGDPRVFMPLVFAGLTFGLPAVVAQGFTYLDPSQ